MSFAKLLLVLFDFDNFSSPPPSAPIPPAADAICSRKDASSQRRHEENEERTLGCYHRNGSIVRPLLSLLPFRIFVLVESS